MIDERDVFARTGAGGCRALAAGYKNGNEHGWSVMLDALAATLA